ncbi:hypothetical protein [Psychrobacter maritimus]|jgi:hypothetical protein|uniref:hypothetical protein n=1 Tax=Psychrobacter maritimus TaxID=256325 RepID=UPI00191B3682|nr:hypothetical protein [Psychrobacter maritimus]
MKKLKYIIVACALGVTGCATTAPEDLFQVAETSLQDRQLQSRFFETNNEVELLSAGVAVLQDMGYSIDETETKSGVVTASKTVDATNNAQIAGAVLLAVLGGGNMSIDSQQQIKVSFVTLPSKNNKNGYLARATFQRIVTNTQGQVTKAETMKTEELYAEFFNKLSKSVFLEAQKI